jgi:hypothetical protein
MKNALITAAVVIGTLLSIGTALVSIQRKSDADMMRIFTYRAYCIDYPQHPTVQKEVAQLREYLQAHK